MCTIILYIDGCKMIQSMKCLAFLHKMDGKGDWNSTHEMLYIKGMGMPNPLRPIEQSRKIWFGC